MVRLLEIGRTYQPRPGSTLPDEPTSLALVLAGSRGRPAWDGTSVAGSLDFFDLKGAVEELLASLAIKSWEFRPTTVPHLHPARSAEVSSGGTVLGTLGELHPRVAQASDCSGAVFVAELSVAAIQQCLPTRISYRPPSPFPPVLRDLAAVVPEETTAERVQSELVAAGAGILEAVQLFDVYRGESIPSGTKSLAYALTYRLADRPLKDQEVDKAHGKIEGRLRHVLGAKIRGKD
jgi:phenylalanyl-tRNA synthetase beta chain